MRILLSSMAVLYNVNDLPQRAYLIAFLSTHARSAPGPPPPPPPILIYDEFHVPDVFIVLLLYM